MKKQLLESLTPQDINEIVATADSLLTGTAWDRITYPTEESFYNAVMERLREQNGIKPPCDTRCAYLISVAEDVTGHRLDETRSAANALVRKFVVHRLTEEGYGRSEAGRALGKDHSTVTNLDQGMNDILSLPKLYSKEVGMYQEFEKRLGGPVKHNES